eukprot:s158_g8.t1
MTRRTSAVLLVLLVATVQQLSTAWLVGCLAHRGVPYLRQGRPLQRPRVWVVRQAAEQNALQEKARTEAAVLFGDSMDLKLPDETALAIRARARRRADWARKRLDIHTGDVLEDIPATLGDRAQDVEREGNLIRQRVEAKRAKERQEAELKATSLVQRQLRRKEEKRLQAERLGSAKERRRAERMAQSRGVELPSLEEAHRMSVVQLRDALWNAGYPARGLPSPADARQLAPEELKERLQKAKVRFLSQLSHVSREETVTIALRNGSIDVILDSQGAAPVRSHSSPCLPRWVKPGDGPSKLERHLSGACRPCLFFRRKADGCRRGDACDHCHLCSAEETRRKLNRCAAAAGDEFIVDGM